ncbi:unnamed protein product [Linum tenue]|uniref:F-box protein At3g26010-like beta-propeller domain-containing protein n=1 Tax=Linum tenue TaxID=586396 RepID=A0AAV0J160_9ROSI|nr:unnamed protein product [Linum tenue]
MCTIRKVISSSSSTRKVGEDEDLLVEILIRLPGHRSAFRCKPVCRRWNSLISAPYFLRRFVSHHQALSAAESESPVLTVSQVRQLILSFLPSRPQIQSEFSVLDCINDLLLLGFQGRETDQELRRTYLICNPFTKQWVALPLAPVGSSSLGWIVKLVREPFDSLGEDQLFPCQFRVVRIYTPITPPASQAEVDVYIFCSRSGRWTKSVLRLDRELRCVCAYRVVSAHGKLYWLNYLQQLVKWDPSSPAALPTLLDGCEIDQRIRCYGLWVLEGVLHLVCKHWMDVDSILSIWRLEENGRGGSWRKQYEFTFPENVRFIVKNKDGREIEVSDLRFQRVIGLHHERSEVVFLSVFDVPHQESAILSWDMRNKEFKFLAYRDKGIRRFDFQADQLFQPRVTFWPSSIPNHKKWRDTYNGSYNCWFSPSN